MSLDVRPESDLKSFTRLQHLSAIPLNDSPIKDRGRSRHIFQILADQSFTKRCVRWQGKKAFRIEVHFWLLVQVVDELSDGRRWPINLIFAVELSCSSHATLRKAKCISKTLTPFFKCSCRGYVCGHRRLYDVFPKHLGIYVLKKCLKANGMVIMVFCLLSLAVDPVRDVGPCCFGKIERVSGSKDEFGLHNRG